MMIKSIEEMLSSRIPIIHSDCGGELEYIFDLGFYLCNVCKKVVY